MGTYFKNTCELPTNVLAASKIWEKCNVTQDVVQVWEPSELSIPSVSRIDCSYSWFLLLQAPNPYPQHLATTILLSVSMSSIFLDSTYKWDRTVLVFICLMNFTYNNALRGQSMLLQMAACLCFSWLNNILMYVCVCIYIYTTFSLSIHPSMDI